MTPALVREHGIPVYAQKGEDHDRYYRHLQVILDTRPNVTMVNDADTKHLFDNRYGTGQSTLDGILLASWSHGT